MFLEADDVGVVGYFEVEDSALAVAFQTVSKKLREKVRFAHTSNTAILEKVAHKYVVQKSHESSWRDKKKKDIV